MIPAIFIAIWILGVRLRAAFRLTLGAAVDLWQTFRYIRMRYRFSAKTTGHRWHSDAVSVWDILERNADSEWIASRPGRHADTRGARYAPAIWYLLRRLWDDRAAQDMAVAAVGKLMQQIRWMLDNPPEPETEHGCINCTCNALARWESTVAA
mgnify:CR=1 FL=1